MAPLLFRRLGNSAILAGLAFALIMPVALLLGLLAGLKENSILDRVITVLSLITTSSPTFALGALMVVVFSIKLHLLPGISALTTETNILHNPWKLVMPVLCLFFAEAGYVARITRASMVEVMASPYIRTAVLKGLPYWKVVFVRLSWPRLAVAPGSPFEGCAGDRSRRRVHDLCGDVDSVVGRCELHLSQPAHPLQMKGQGRGAHGL